MLALNVSPWKTYRPEPEPAKPPPLPLALLSAIVELVNVTSGASDVASPLPLQNVSVLTPMPPPSRYGLSPAEDAWLPVMLEPSIATVARSATSTPPPAGVPSP